MKDPLSTLCFLWFFFIRPGLTNIMMAQNSMSIEWLQIHRPRTGSQAPANVQCIAKDIWTEWELGVCGLFSHVIVVATVGLCSLVRFNSSYRIVICEVSSSSSSHHYHHHQKEWQQCWCCRQYSASYEIVLFRTRLLVNKNIIVVSGEIVQISYVQWTHFIYRKCPWLTDQIPNHWRGYAP